MQMTDHEKELAEIQASVHGLSDNVDLYKKGRRFMMKEELTMLESEPANAYCVCVFNDMLLITERMSKKLAVYKYVTHMDMKDIFFSDCTDSKEKYAFEIIQKNEKKKFKFAVKDRFSRSLWQQVLTKQIERYTPTDTTITGGESIMFGSPSDRSAQGDSPPNDPLLERRWWCLRCAAKEDWSSTASGNRVNCTKDIDETESDGDESECEFKEVQHSDGTTIFSHANLHTILWWLINNGEFGAEPILIKTFLHSCVAFTSSTTLFQNLMQIFDLEIPVPKAISVRHSLHNTRRRIIFFMRMWVEFFFDRDFYPNRPLFCCLLDFLNDLKKYNLQQESNILKLVIIRLNKERLHYEKGLVPGYRWRNFTDTRTHGQHSPLAEVPAVTSPEIKLIDWDITAAAEQFVLIEFQLFKAIELKEILNFVWKSEHPCKDALNIFKIFNRFDLVSSWAATEVVMAQSPKQRFLNIEKLITLAQKCLELRNYNSLVEIMEGLNRGSVQSLKKTWEAVSHTSKGTFEALNSVVYSLQNDKNYRKQLGSSFLPCLPYFGILIHDLRDINGNPVKIGDNVNFEKIYELSSILKEIQLFQCNPYPFKEDETLSPLVHKLLAMPEEMLYKHSQTIEP